MDQLKSTCVRFDVLHKPDTSITSKPMKNNLNDIKEYASTF